MKDITINELQDNLDFYLGLSNNEHIYVRNNNEIIAVISNPKETSWNDFFKLKGCLAEKYNDEPYDELIGDEIIKKHQ